MKQFSSICSIQTVALCTFMFQMYKAAGITSGTKLYTEQPEGRDLKLHLGGHEMKLYPGATAGITSGGPRDEIIPGGLRWNYIRGLQNESDVLPQVLPSLAQASLHM